MKKILAAALTTTLMTGSACAEIQKQTKKEVKQVKKQIPLPVEKEMKGEGRDLLASKILDAYGVKYMMDHTKNRIIALRINDLSFKKFSLHLYTKMNEKRETGFTYRLQVHIEKRVMNLVLGASTIKGKEYCYINKGAVQCGR